MNRRTFILSAITFLCQFFWNCEPVIKKLRFNNKPKKTTRVVDQLRWIDDVRRNMLAGYSDVRSAKNLNELVPEIEAIELSNTCTNKPGKTLRVITWNMKHGRTWRNCVQFIKNHPFLNEPDVMLLCGMDLGMARSRNEHTAKEFARALEMNYAYGVEFLELTKGDRQERAKYPGENEWGYHGNAILSKYPVKNLRMIRFPGIERWFDHDQKRLGGRMALFADIEMNGQTVTLVSTHLEQMENDPCIRQEQVKMILNELKNSSPGLPTIIGGDFNATPDHPLFDDLVGEGFQVENCNEMETPTQQSKEAGKIYLAKNHVDYLVVKKLEIINDETSPKTVLAAFQDQEKIYMLSDHAIVTVKVCVGSYYQKKFIPLRRDRTLNVEYRRKNKSVSY